MPAGAQRRRGLMGALCRSLLDQRSLSVGDVVGRECWLNRSNTQRNTYLPWKDLFSYQLVLGLRDLPGENQYFFVVHIAGGKNVMLPTRPNPCLFSDFIYRHREISGGNVCFSLRKQSLYGLLFILTGGFNLKRPTRKVSRQGIRSIEMAMGVELCQSIPGSYILKSS